MTICFQSLFETNWKPSRCCCFMGVFMLFLHIHATETLVGYLIPRYKNKMLQGEDIYNNNVVIPKRYFVQSMEVLLDSKLNTVFSAILIFSLLFMFKDFINLLCLLNGLFLRK